MYYRPRFVNYFASVSGLLAFRRLGHNLQSSLDTRWPEESSSNNKVGSPGRCLFFGRYS
jgi:hypothetical protein